MFPFCFTCCNIMLIYVCRTRINLTVAAAKYTLGKIKFMARCCLGDSVLRFIVIHSCVLYTLKFTDRSLLSHNSNILIVIIFSTPFQYCVRLKIIRERNFTAIYVYYVKYIYYTQFIHLYNII